MSAHHDAKPLPLQVIGGLEAYSSLSGNALYPSPERNPERLSPYARVGHSPTFTIDQSDKVYAIGSCFAREIEKALSRAGLDVLSLAPRHTGEGKRHQHVVNNYNPCAVRQDLEFALDGKPGADGFAVNIDAAERRWANYALGGGDALKTGSREEVLAAHERVLAAHRTIPQCKLVVLTLGLVETWFDRQTGHYLNIAPHRPAVKQHPGRFEMHVLSYDQILAELNTIRDLLKRHAEVDQQMLLTVSPVPLHATFRDQDVLQANAYSKAVLRAAAEAFVLSRDDVTYFPSFEFVSSTDRSRAFGSKDFRHVNSAMVDVIMESTLRNYVIDHPPTKTEALSLLKNGEYRTLADALTKAVRQGAKIPTFLRYYGGTAMMKRGMREEALEHLSSVADEMPKHYAARMLIAEMLLEKGDDARAREVMAEIPEDYAPADALRKRLAVDA